MPCRSRELTERLTQRQLAVRLLCNRGQLGERHPFSPGEGARLVRVSPLRVHGGVSHVSESLHSLKFTRRRFAHMYSQSVHFELTPYLLRTI